MRLVKVNSIPEKNTTHSRLDLIKMIEDFVMSDMDYAKVLLDTGEYSCAEYARSSLGQAIRRTGYPVDVKYRNGEIYLVRRSADV
jgi:hypothetical protein